MSETKRPGRNEPCHCGSGKKYKQCCLASDEEADRRARAQEAEAAPAVAARDEHQQRTPAARRQADQHWKSAAKSARAFHKVAGPRKIGSS